VPDIAGLALRGPGPPYTRAQGRTPTAMRRPGILGRGAGSGPASRAAGTVAGALLAVLLAGCGRTAPAQEAPPTLDRAPSLEGLAGLAPEARALIQRTAAELDRMPESAQRWLELAEVLHAHGQFGPAETCYRQGLLRAPEDARGWHLLAVVQGELGESAEALASFEVSTRLDPSAPWSHWRLGQAWLDRGELERAAAEMEAARALAPHDAAAVVGLARVRLQQHDFERAAELLAEHLRLMPRDGNARYLLGTAYRGLGREEDAARILAGNTGGEPIRRDPWVAEVLARRRGERAEFQRAVDALGRGDVEGAIEGLEALRQRRPEDTLVLINLHRAYRMRGDTQRAIELLEEARRIDPLESVVHLHLAGAWREKAHAVDGALDHQALENALASSETACELSPTFAQAHGMHGDVLTDLGRIEEAAAAFQRAAATDPDEEMWQERAGMSLVRLGRWEEALPFLQRLDQLHPRAPRVLLQLAACLANSGRLDEARAPLLEARSLAPQDATIAKAIADLERARAASGSTREEERR